MMREWLGMSVGLLIAVAVFGPPARAQVNFDRPGGDYASFPMRSGDPAQCAARCERDARCRAWAFSYPVTENANAVCWLKSRVMPRLASTCCVSGVRGTGVIEPRGGPTEFLALLGVGSADGVWGRSHRRRLSALRTASRRQREELRSCL